MRKKLARLTLALAVLGVALFFPPSADSRTCRLFCCPDGGCMICCGPCHC